MKTSILQNAKECFFTGTTENLQCHHIFPGTANRRMSDKNGFWVWLRYDYHVGTPYAVHNDRERMTYLQRLCQKEFEKTHTREEFIALIGRSYL